MAKLEVGTTYWTVGYTMGCKYVPVRMKVCGYEPDGRMIVSERGVKVLVDPTTERMFKTRALCMAHLTATYPANRIG